MTAGEGKSAEVHAYRCARGLGLYSKGTELSRLLAGQTWCAIFSEGLVGIGYDRPLRFFGYRRFFRFQPSFTTIKK